MTDLITASNITVNRGETKILDNVSLTIGESEFITILGPNGGGKSMLLKCLMGFYIPDNGNIKRKRHLRIGYVPQQFTSEQTMPISVGQFLRLRKKVSAEELETITAETNIEALVNKPLNILSGGELQRILVARALIGAPDLLILDEPAQNLDISGQLAFYKLLSEIYEKTSFSILMVSHDLHMVMATTKKVICLFHHVCCSGEPQVVTKDPEFITLFGNDMAEMMAVYQHGHNHSHAH
ncbi:MAG: ATP-binding cassette domain-containing protein [Alphaproteobacteria bacterium]